MEHNYAIGSPFLFEMEMTPFEGWSETISIRGTVVYNDGVLAVVKVSQRNGEFDGVVHSLEETRNRFPGFDDILKPGELNDYLWVQTDVEGFDGFIPNDEF